MEEYMIHVWGGAWNNNANPSIEKDYGIKEGYHYFQTKEERDKFMDILSMKKYSSQGLVYEEQFGAMSHLRTIFVGTFEYCEKEFILHTDFGNEFPEDRAIFMFEDGNYSCDCNISLFIQDEYGENSIPFLRCGNEIKLKEYHFEYTQ